MGDDRPQEPGYVALSRVRTLAGLSLAGLNTRALEVHPGVLAKDAEFRMQSQKARERLGGIPTQEMQTMHENFVRACGGKPGMGRAHKSDLSKQRGSTLDITQALLKNAKSIAEIASTRGLAATTIVNHLEEIKLKGKIDATRDLAHLEKPQRFETMKTALEAVRDSEGKVLLSPARALLGESYGYDDLRLARLFLSLE